MTTTPPHIPLWFPFVVFAAVLCISGILATRSGWRRIAARFPYQGGTNHRKYYPVRMSLGIGTVPVAYGACVIVRLHPHGLGLSVIFPIRFMHPPLFIPWAEMAGCAREYTARYDVTRITIRNEDSVLSFYGRVGEDIYSAYVSRDRQGKP